MKQNVLTSYNGKIFEATGALPKDALVFAPSQKVQPRSSLNNGHPRK